MTRQEQNERLNDLYSERLNLEANLKDTDYIAAKIAEGKATKTEYKDKITERQSWRDRINEVDAEIGELKAITEFDDDVEPLLTN